MASRAQMAVYLIGAWHHASGRGRPSAAPSRPLVEVSDGDAAVVIDNVFDMTVVHDAGLALRVPTGALPDGTRLSVATASAPADASSLAGPVFEVAAVDRAGAEVDQLAAEAELRLPKPEVGLPRQL